VRIVDLTQFMAGPYGTQLLAFLGADVIKVEQPERGDPIRSLSKHYQNGMAAHFACGNASKRSMTLNLRHAEGRALLLDLVRECDVLIDNFRPGTLDRLGLDEATLRSANPSLVIASVTGFGKTGPWSPWPAYDLIAQAAGGGMSITGEAGRPPVKMGLPVGDLAAGVMAALGITAALLRRERTGEGDTIDISMMDVQLSMLNYHAHFFFASGESPGPEGDGHPNIVPYKSFPTADGRIVVAVYGDRFWAGFCRAVELERLVEDPRFATNAQRLANRVELVGLIEAKLRERPRAAWQERLVSEGVPAAPVLDVGEALTNEHSQAREMVVTVEGPDGEPMELIGNPIKTRGQTPTPLAPPSLGQDTDAILAELGHDADSIRRMHAEGIA
jgi:crotonobetainyl-CoA:carnitine CoA-transferase CaiB-like acyl-CoA transferase